MTVQQLCNNMEVPELMEWMAFHKTQDDEWIKKYELELQKDSTPEEEAARIKAMFAAMRAS